jgi:hypothetical protein
VLIPVNANLMTPVIQISALLCICAVSTFLSVGYACEPPIVVAPDENAVIQSPRPLIAWISANPQDAHDIEVIVRVPEGEILQRLQRTVYALQWQPDAALAGQNTTVSVRVSRRCPGKGVASSERKFHVALAGACPMPTGLSPARVGRFLRVEWKNASSFKALELRSFFGPMATAGDLVTAERPPAFVLLGGVSPQVVGVRAVCVAGVSDWAWLPVALP